MDRISEYQLENLLDMAGGALALTNAFSINMLTGDKKLQFTQIHGEDAKRLAVGGISSHIGHADMAKLVGEQLGCEVPMVRDTTQLRGVMLVAQYKGPRLPEGTTTLPEGATVEWWLVEDLSWYN